MNTPSTQLLAKVGNFVGLRFRELWAAVNQKASQQELHDSIHALKENVPADGDTLRKLYESIQPVSHYYFNESVAPTIAHNSGRIPSAVTIVDSTGRPHFASYSVLDNNTIRINFTEATSGSCSITFRR